MCDGHGLCRHTIVSFSRLCTGKRAVRCHWFMQRYKIIPPDASVTAFLLQMQPGCHLPAKPVSLSHSSAICGHNAVEPGWLRRAMPWPPWGNMWSDDLFTPAPSRALNISTLPVGEAVRSSAACSSSIGGVCLSIRLSKGKRASSRCTLGSRVRHVAPVFLMYATGLISTAKSGRWLTVSRLSPQSLWSSLCHSRRRELSPISLPAVRQRAGRWWGRLRRAGWAGGGAARKPSRQKC